MRIQMEDSFEVVAAGAPGSPSSSPVLLTCEHASARVPPPYVFDPEDAWIEHTHWSYDIGAADLTRELAERWGATAVLSRFTRLLVDPNRPEGHPELFRAAAEGRPIRTNRGLSDRDRERRLELLYRAFHEEVDTRVRSSAAETLLSVHSFTDVYEGARRELEVGILFDVEDTLARRVVDGLAGAGFRAALNEPYSGKEGLIYSVDRHARAHGRRALEIEVRQDLIVDGEFRRRLVESLSESIFSG